MSVRGGNIANNEVDFFKDLKRWLRVKEELQHTKKRSPLHAAHAKSRGGSDHDPTCAPRACQVQTAAE